MFVLLYSIMAAARPMTGARMLAVTMGAGLPLLVEVVVTALVLVNVVDLPLESVVVMGTFVDEVMVVVEALLVLDADELPDEVLETVSVPEELLLPPGSLEVMLSILEDAPAIPLLMSLRMPLGLGRMSS